MPYLRQEREEVVGKNLPRAAMSEHETPDEQELVEAADCLFLELDRSEQIDSAG